MIWNFPPFEIIGQLPGPTVINYPRVALIAGIFGENIVNRALGKISNETFHEYDILFCLEDNNILLPTLFVQSNKNICLQHSATLH